MVSLLPSTSEEGERKKTLSVEEALGGAKSRTNSRIHCCFLYAGVVCRVLVPGSKSRRREGVKLRVGWLGYSSCIFAFLGALIFLSSGIFPPSRMVTVLEFPAVKFMA